MASASLALLLSRLSPLPAAASRFLRPLASAGTFLPAVLVPSPAAAPGAPARRFVKQSSSPRTQPRNAAAVPPRRRSQGGITSTGWSSWKRPQATPATPTSTVTRSSTYGYIKTLAQVVGSEDEARMKIYSVSTRHYFSFGALVSNELAAKLRELPKVRWVLPDSYVDVRNKDYGGEPFIDGQAVPYDPKYHEEWVRQ